MGQIKREHQFWSQNIAVAVKQKNLAKCAAKLWGLEYIFQTPKAKYKILSLYF